MSQQHLEIPNTFTNKIVSSAISDGSNLRRFQIQSKYLYLNNKMITIFLLFLIPIAINSVAIFHNEWFLQGSVYFSLLYVHDKEIDEDFSYSGFIDRFCNDYKMEIKCKFYEFFQISGIFLFILYLLAIIFSIFFEVTLLIMIKWPNIFQDLKSRKVLKMKIFSILAIIFHTLANLVYLITCLSKKTHEEIIGIDFYLVLIAFVFNFILFLYYYKIKSKLKKNQMTKNLLSPDRLLENELGIRRN